MRSIAKHFYIHDGIRVDAICPGIVRTNLLSSKEWKQFPDEYFTPVEKIVETVLLLVDGVDMVDAKGKRIEAKQAWGRSVEINGQSYYFGDQLEYCDDAMREVMRATDVENSMKKN